MIENLLFWAFKIRPIVSHCNQNFFCVENLKKIFYSFSLALSCAVWPDVAIKNSPILSKSCPKIQQWIFLLMYIRFFKKPKKSPNFGYFFKNIRFLELSKIAQFGNTALVLKIIDDREALSCQILFSITKIFFKQIVPFPTSFSLFSYL